jgi:hypothetical protein
VKKQQYGRYALMKALSQVRETERLTGSSIYSGLPVDELNYGFVFNDFIFAKNKTLFRPLGIIDWAWFTTAKLRGAVLGERMSDYYTEMLNDPRSPSNKWRDKEKEKEMKDYYANRYSLAAYSSEGV